MGIVPIWGYQLAVGLLLAHLFKLNKSIFFVFVNISLPPMIPVILYFSYLIGGYLIGDSHWILSLDDISFEALNIKQYIVGGFALAFIAGILFGIASYAILIVTKKR